MFTIPGFDPKTLTNEDLFEKQIELTHKKIQASRFSSFDALNQIQVMIDAIDLERRERIFSDRIGSVIVSSPPVIIESDPVLKARDELVMDAETEKKTKTVAKPIRRPIRTARPVKPTEPS